MGLGSERSWRMRSFGRKPIPSVRSLNTGKSPGDHRRYDRYAGLVARPTSQNCTAAPILTKPFPNTSFSNSTPCSSSPVTIGEQATFSIERCRASATKLGPSAEACAKKGSLRAMGMWYHYVTIRRRLQNRSLPAPSDQSSTTIAPQTAPQRPDGFRSAAVREHQSDARSLELIR